MCKIGNNTKVLEACNLEKEIYALWCYKAMSYLSQNWYLVADGDNEDATVLERNYVLSMVFHMGMHSIIEDELGMGVFLSGENTKHVDDCIDDIRKTYKKIYKKEIELPLEVIPDLVIHTSHDKRSTNSNGQHVIIEAKTTKKLSKSAFFKDLFKLNTYLCRFDFDNAIYVIVNTDKNRIENLIKLYFESDCFFYKDKLESLLFFIQEGKDTSPQTYKLSAKIIQIINNRK